MWIKSRKLTRVKQKSVFRNNVTTNRLLNEPNWRFDLGFIALAIWKTIQSAAEICWPSASNICLIGFALCLGVSLTARKAVCFVLSTVFSSLRRKTLCRRTAKCSANGQVVVWKPSNRERCRRETKAPKFVEPMTKGLITRQVRKPLCPVVFQKTVIAFFW